jgi:hypothetical protein
MKLARRALNDPERLHELRRELDAQLAELLAEATDAGYSSREVIDAMQGLCAHQIALLSEDPDPADDPPN